ncbi:FG-GAP-like repeat-containing protein [Streptomyces sp. NPDC001759]
MHKPLRLALASATAAALTGGLLTLTAAPATAAPSGLTADFNGDGYRDTAVGAPCATVGTVSCAGAVVVLYGSSSGVSATRKTVITQNSTGVPGTAEELDRFGGGLATGDLDADGYADLIVGTPNEGIGDRAGVGSATVIWGSKSGLSGGASLPSPSGLNEWGGYSGSIATGDFNGDGRTDVTITGQSRTGLYRGPFARTGKPAVLSAVDEVGSTDEVIAGNIDGDLAAERAYPYTQESDEAGVIEYVDYDPEGWDNHPGSDYTTTALPAAEGHQGAVGDIDGDGYGDLVLGDHQDPRADKPSGHKGGQISVWYGGPNGPDPAQTPAIVHQDTTGVPGSGEADDLFGSALAVGDINGDKYADVAVGAFGEDNGTAKESGSVTVLFGSATGLKTSNAKSYTQNTTGVPGSSETGDAFGMTVRLTDLDKNGKADLVIGTGYENGYGAITVLKGTASGLTTTGAKSFTARDLSLKGGADLGWEIAQ